MVKSIWYKRVLKYISSAPRHSVRAVTAGCVGRFPSWLEAEDDATCDYVFACLRIQFCIVFPSCLPVLGFPL